MKILFHKYQGAGNDFVIIDDRENKLDANNQKLIAFLCDRRFGIGADGLILLREHNKRYQMIYFNSDGNESTLCGNGGRCFAAFIFNNGLVDEKMEFEAIDGNHFAWIDGGTVHLGMQNVAKIKEYNSQEFFANTGSPHHVLFVKDTDAIEVSKEGKSIAYGELYGKEGANVNFVKATTKGLKLRTFERGVDDETLACGTGVTAAALCYHNMNPDVELPIAVKAKGGDLSVNFEANEQGYSKIVLSGPARFVFKGVIDV